MTQQNNTNSSSEEGAERGIKRPQGVLQHMSLVLGSKLPSSHSKESSISSPVIGVGGMNTNQAQTKGPKKQFLPKFKSPKK